MKVITDKSPNQVGFSMPAEWDKHAATWTSWPFDDELWFNQLEDVRCEFAALVKTIAGFEQVHLLVRDAEAHADAYRRIGEHKNVIYHMVELDDIWLRDNGPIFITRDDQVSFVKFIFNAWGEKFNYQLDNLAPYKLAEHLELDYFKAPFVFEGGALDVNSTGLALTTKSCLLQEKRNPTLTISDYEQQLQEYLGITKVLWLDAGLAGDHTDGHIDTIARFVNDNTILYCITEDEASPNYEVLQQNFNLLSSSVDQAGEPLQLVPLVIPKHEVMFDGEWVPKTYANFYIGNGFVVVPQYGDPHDVIALATIADLFPEREVIGLSSKALILGGGSFHCATQQQPI